MSLNYSYNNGIMGGAMASNYQRYGGRINSEHVLLRGKHDIITIGENLSYWYHKSHDLAEGNGYFNMKSGTRSSYYPGCDALPWHFTGSVAAHFETLLREALAELRDHLDTSRKYALMILEYCDNAKITRLQDDRRVFY